MLADEVHFFPFIESLVGVTYAETGNDALVQYPLL
jgi:hypothetical protein